MSVILFKVAVAVVVSVLAIPALRSSFQGLSESSFIIRVLALQTLTELMLFVTLYVVGGQEVPSDVPAYYLPAAREVLAGHIPFRDFQLSYGPLFAYIGSVLVHFWDSGKSFALFAILVNAGALVAWHRASVSLTDTVTARRASILYATNGHLALQTMLGTNQVWVALGLALSVGLIAKNRSSSSGITQALTASATKFLALLFWPVLWICAPQRVHWLVGALALIAVYAIFAMAGGDVLYPIRHEGELVTSGNLPYLLAPVLRAVGINSPHLFDGAALAILVVANVWLFRRALPLTAERRPQLVFGGLALVGTLFMVFSKKSFTSYSVFFMYPAIVMLLSRVQRPWASLYFLLPFNVLLVVEPTLWFRFGGKGRALEDWIPHLTVGAATIFLATELALMVCYGYLVFLSVAHLRRRGATPNITFNRDGYTGFATAPDA